jgi:carbon-monoxide dehydrogenase iron sulfur subunit
MMSQGKKTAAPDHGAEFANSVAGRRTFIKTVVIGGVALATDCLVMVRVNGSTEPELRRIVVDYNRCAGCRTCEVVCAQVNNRIDVNGESLWGLGNPRLARIHVYHFNPDVDVPVVCVLCEDAPCTQACPVPPDGNGHRAIYRDSTTRSIKSDLDRCVGCRSCMQACREKRVGAVIANSASGKPERLCTLCDGDPKCVKYCPYDALSFERPPTQGDAQIAPVESIAGDLSERWYRISDRQGGS